MDPKNPKFLYVFNLNKDNLTRSNLHRGHYDSSKSNLLYGFLSIRKFIYLFSTFFISLLLIISFYYLYLTYSDNDDTAKLSLRDLFLFTFQLGVFVIILVSGITLREDISKLSLFLYQILVITHIVLVFILLVYSIFTDYKLLLFTISMSSPYLLLFCFALITIELYCLYILFIFTYNVILGNDAYLEGEFFNKYVENLASSNAPSSVNTPKRDFNQFKDDLN